MPTISVIVPVYKVEKYIHRCVDSILNQTFRDFELILVDDGSPDNCGAICDEYAKKDSRIHVIHQANGGLSAARNAGIDWAFANSDSQWLTFIDSDDWVHCEYLSFLYNAAIEQQVKISICAFVRTDGQEIDEFRYRPITVCSPQRAYLRVNNQVTAYAWGALYQRGCYEKIRFPVGKLFEDMFTTYKVLFSTDRIACSETVLYYYFLNEDSITLEKWKPERLAQLEALEEQKVIFKHDRGLYKAIIVSYITILVAQYNRFLKLPKEERIRYRKYVSILKSKLQRTLLYAHFRNFTKVNNEAYVYETAFPGMMRVYWYGVSILRKLGIRK